MAPPSSVDTSTSDLNPTAATAPPTKANSTLILCPPSVSSRPAVLENALATVADRAAVDVQMLDRLAMNLVTLPEGIYSTVLLLSDPAAAQEKLDRPLFQKVLKAMAPGARWKSHGANKENWAKETISFLTAGFLVEDSSEGVVAVKPDFGGQKSVSLNLKKRTAGAAVTVAKPVAKLVVATAVPVPSNGVGFVDFSDDLDDDDLIDEDELMADEDLATPVQMPAECRPKPGKRRRACKDCTCGLKEQIEQEDQEKRSAADTALAAAKEKAAKGVKLTADDLAEIDFTVEGKASSCGNCYLGDAFRCSGCPYVGLPAFKPGEQVQIDMMDDQL